MPTTRNETHWSYWACGALISLVSLRLVPPDPEVYGSLGIIALLFYWGFLAVERANPTDDAL